MRHKSDLKDAFRAYRAIVMAGSSNVPDTVEVHTWSDNMVHMAGDGFKVIRLVGSGILAQTDKRYYRGVA